MLSIIINKIESTSSRKLHYILICIGLLIAIQIQYIQHGWINPDSVLYFESARLINLGLWHEAFKLFNWPFYSTCLVGIHELTNLSIHHSAQVLNVILFGITTTSFLRIIELAGGKSLAVFSGAVILFSSQYVVGDILAMLLRDEGFWAFFLTSLVFFIRFYRSKSYLDAFLWQICIMIATLFRIEGIVYLILVPLTIMFSVKQTLQTKCLHFLKSNFLSIMALGCIFAAVLISDDITMKSFGRLQEVFSLNLYQEFTKNLFAKSAIMSQLVLGKFLQEYATQGILVTFIYIILIKIISATGIVNIGLTGYGLKDNFSLIKQDAKQILIGTALIAVIIMALIITKVFVLSGRYVISLTFILMIFASFYFAELLTKFRNPAKLSLKVKTLSGLVLVYIVLNFTLNLLPKNNGYNYLQEAASWINKSNTLKQPVFYDNLRVRYYAGASLEGAWQQSEDILKSSIDDKSILNYHYLVISTSAKKPETERVIKEQLPEYAEIKRFSPSKPVKFIVIYEKKTL